MKNINDMCPFSVFSSDLSPLCSRLDSLVSVVRMNWIVKFSWQPWKLQLIFFSLSLQILPYYESCLLILATTDFRSPTRMFYQMDSPKVCSVMFSPQTLELLGQAPLSAMNLSTQNFNIAQLCGTRWERKVLSLCKPPTERYLSACILICDKVLVP